jgi:hypothetical protein
MRACDSVADGSLSVICRIGARGEKAQQTFIDAGFTNVNNVKEETDACVPEGLPVVRGRKPMSFKPQVRITAGFVVPVGALLVISVHPYLAGLSAFVGAGLMFAGIPDSCAIDPLIARMPWNQVEDETPQAGIRTHEMNAAHLQNGISTCGY